jgi:hypothetical protein
MKEKLKTQSYSTSKKIPTNRSGSKKRNSLYDNSIKEKGVGWNAPLPKVSFNIGFMAWLSATTKP